ncbi:MAG: hypothetical protein ACK4WD_06590 [Flavobacteriales bacterium]|jgi:hypothetical protein
MINQLRVVCGLFFLLLVGCISEETQNAAAQAASTIRAKKYKVGKGTSARTGEGSYVSLNIEFSDFDGLQDGYDNEKLSSVAALVFFRNLKPNEYSGVDKIQVRINRENSTEETLYDIKQLIEAESYFKVATNLITSFHEKSIPAMQACIDTTIIDVSSQQEIMKAFAQLDSAYGQFNNHIFTAFKFTETTEENIPVFVTWCEFQRNSATTDLKLILNTSTDKVIFIGDSEE